MTRRWSLRTRFVAAASLCLLPLLGVVLFVLDQSLEHSRDQLLDTEFAIANVVAGGLAETLAENESVLIDLAASEPIRKMDATAAQDPLNQTKRNRPLIYGLFLADPQHNIIASAGIQPGSVSSELDRVLQDALNLGENGVSNRLTVPGDDTPVIALIVPVQAADQQATEGKPIGAVGALLSVDRLQRSFAPAFRFAGSSDIIIAVVAEDEAIVAQRNNDPEAQNLTAELKDPIAAAVAGERGQLSYPDQSGDERLAVFLPVDFTPAQWAVVVTNPSPTAYGPNRDLLERGLIALAAAVMLTLVLSVIFGELTARPLRQLTNQAAAITKGNFDQTVQPVGRGEIASLSAAFRDMAGRLTSQVRDLEGTRTQVEFQAERLRDLLRRTVRLQEDERRRIASEIHDAVSPLITGALYQARALRLAAGANGNGSNGHHEEEPAAVPDGSTDAALAAVTDLLEQAMDELHDVIFALRPPDLDDLGVVAAIDRYVSQINRTGLPSHLEVIGEEQRLSPEARLGVYRVVQEALHNALRHAQADEAVVKLEWTEDLLRVTIRDNGSGFNPEQAARPTSLGLLSMHERATAIGGKLEISSRPGGGTAVILERSLDTDLVLEPVAGVVSEPEAVASPPIDEPRVARPSGAPVAPAGANLS